MPYTDKQMKDATQIAYLDFGGAWKCERISHFRHVRFRPQGGKIARQ
jgi:hypothetical protein